MFVPEGYVSLDDAVEYVARIREPEAVAELTPDGFAFFARVDAALHPPVALPAAPIRSIRAGPSLGYVRNLQPPAPAPAVIVEPSPEAEAKIEGRVRRWGAARQKLSAAKDNARSDLQHALISGPFRAAAISEDGNLITMQPARWRVAFARRQLAGLVPFAEAVEGRDVPVAANASGSPTAWGRPIMARADLARWCGGPPEAEPAERPRDWTAPRLAPQSLPHGGAWWTAEQFFAWLVFGRATTWQEARESRNVPNDKAAEALLRETQCRISAAIADRRLPAWGQETADISKAPLRDTLVLIPPEDFAGPSGLIVQWNGWACPPDLGRRYEGRWWQGMRFEAAAVRSAFPAAPALSDLPEWWTLVRASVWVALRDTAAVRDAGPSHHGKETRGHVGWYADWAWRSGTGAAVGPHPGEADELLIAAARRGAIRGRGTPHTSDHPKAIESYDWALITIAEDQRERGAKYLCPERGDGSYWRGVLLARDDVVREWPAFDVAEAATAESPPAVPSPPEPVMTAESVPGRANAGQAYSSKALASWFLLRVNTWPEGKPPPSEAECVVAAQIYFAEAPGRDVIRAIRQKKTPQSWRKPGPKPRR